MIEYRIIKNTYTDEKGVEGTTNYNIQTYRRFLYFWMKWRNITHLVCGMGDCYQSTTTWKTWGGAEKFAQEFICKGKHYDGWEEKVETTGKCGK